MTAVWYGLCALFFGLQVGTVRIWRLSTRWVAGTVVAGFATGWSVVMAVVDGNGWNLAAGAIWAGTARLCVAGFRQAIVHERIMAQIMAFRR